MKNILKLGGILLMSLVMSCDKGDEVDVTPANPVLISPLKNQSCELGIKGVNNTSRLTFRWERAKNAQTYDLILTNLETGQNYITYTDIADNFKELILVNDVPYSWKVVSKNSGSATNGSSEVWKFFFVGEARNNYAPFPANILGPKQSANVAPTSGKVNLIWQGSDPDSSTLNYTIYLDKINGLQAPADAMKNLSASNLEVAVDGNTTYYWRVKTSDGFGSSYSPVYTFKTN